MSKPRLIYYDVLDYQAENLELLERHFDLVRLPDPSHNSAVVLARAVALLAPVGHYCGQETLAQAPLLRVIGSNTTGDSHIDVAAARARGIQVVTLEEQREFLESIAPAAELAWGLVIALTRNVAPAFRSVLEGRWDHRPFVGRAMLSRMTLGLAGLGRVGRRVGSYGLAFGMTVRGYDPRPVREVDGVARVASLAELVHSSDVVTVHIPHEPETEGLFDAETFARFKKGAFFVNTARAELVDHRALLEALRSGDLAGAALDVFEGEFEPGFGAHFPEHPLLAYAREHTNLILTPHIGGSTLDARRLTESHAIRLMIEALSGPDAS